MKKLQTSRIDATMLEQSDYRDVRVLAASVNEDHTVPSGAAYCLISSDAELWVKPGGTATIPAGDVTDGTGQICVRAGKERIIRLIEGTAAITTLGLISAGTPKVTLEFFK